MTRRLLTAAVCVALLASACTGGTSVPPATSGAPEATVATAAPIVAAPTTTAISEPPLVVELGIAHGDQRAIESHVATREAAIKQDVPSAEPMLADDPEGLLADDPDKPCPGHHSDDVRNKRNCNPGNLGRLPTGELWQGEVPCSDIEYADGTRNEETRFACFRSDEWGFRALALNVRARVDRHEERTLSEVIEAWAPPGPPDYNAPTAYVASVRNTMSKWDPRFDVDGDTDLTVGNRLADLDFMSALAFAIGFHEGGEHYRRSTVEAGVRMALGRS